MTLSLSPLTLFECVCVCVWVCERGREMVRATFVFCCCRVSATNYSTLLSVQSVLPFSGVNHFTGCFIEFVNITVFFNNKVFLTLKLNKICIISYTYFLRLIIYNSYTKCLYTLSCMHTLNTLNLKLKLNIKSSNIWGYIYKSY